MNELGKEYERAGWELLRELLVLRDEESYSYLRLIEHPHFESMFREALEGAPAKSGPDPRTLGLAQLIDFCPFFREDQSRLRQLADRVIEGWNALCQEAETVAIQEELGCSEPVARAQAREYELADPKTFGSLSVLTGILARPSCLANDRFQQQQLPFAKLLRRSILDPREGDERHPYELFACARAFAGERPIESLDLVRAMAERPHLAAHGWLVEAGFELEALRRTELTGSGEPQLPAYDQFQECYDLGPRNPGSMANAHWTWRDAYEAKGWSLWRHWNRRQPDESLDWLRSRSHWGRALELPENGFSERALEFLDLALSLKSSPLAEPLSSQVQAVELAWWDWARRESEGVRQAAAEGTYEHCGALGPTLMLACSDRSDGQSLPLLVSLLDLPHSSARELLSRCGLDTKKLRERLRVLTPPSEPPSTLGHRLLQAFGLLQGAKDRTLRTHDLLLALLQDSESAAGQVLGKLGVDSFQLSTLAQDRAYENED